MKKGKPSTSLEIKDLYPYKRSEYQVLDVVPKECFIQLLESINVKKNILTKYQEKQKITNQDIEFIELLIQNDNLTLHYDQRLLLAMIKSEI